MIIAKFGGTSVASKERIDNIVEIVRNELKRQPVLVVSAVSGVTDLLLKGKIAQVRKIHGKLAGDLFDGNPDTLSQVMEYVNANLNQAQAVVNRGKLSPFDLDELVSYGEIISSFIISAYLGGQGIISKQVIASELIVTDDNFTQAEFLPEQTERKIKARITPLIEKGIVPVVTGFIGATKSGKITTLGRGGSDYSASILGFALNAKEVQIWTDVDGIYTADPRVVKSAVLIPQVSFREASEMATFGAKVLHPRTIRPAVEKNIPVRVLNTFNPASGGTLITRKSTGEGLKAISFKKNTALITISSANMLFSKGFLVRIFEILARYNISVDLVSVSEVSVSVTLDNTEHLSEALKELEKLGSVTVSTQFGTVSLIGENLATSHDVMKDVAKVFHRNDIPIRMISWGASDINISLVIGSENVERAANLLHDRLLLGRRSSL